MNKNISGPFDGSVFDRPFEECTFIHALHADGDKFLHTPFWKSEYGTAKDFWEFMCMKYADRRLLPQYSVQDENDVFAVELSKRIQHILTANEFKYHKLLQTMEEYDPLKPYNIQEEHLTATKIDKQKTTPDVNETTGMYETSFDSQSVKLAGENRAHTTGSTTLEYDNTITESFEDKTLTGNSTVKNYNSRIGNIGNHTYADIVNKERQSAYFSFWEILATDILSEITFRIF